MKVKHAIHANIQLHEYEEQPRNLIKNYEG